MSLYRKFEWDQIHNAGGLQPPYSSQKARAVYQDALRTVFGSDAYLRAKDMLEDAVVVADTQPYKAGSHVADALKNVGRTIDGLAKEEIRILSYLYTDHICGNLKSKGNEDYYKSAIGFASGLFESLKSIPLEDQRLLREFLYEAISLINIGIADRRANRLSLPPEFAGYLNALESDGDSVIPNYTRDGFDDRVNRMLYLIPGNKPSMVQ